MKNIIIIIVVLIFNINFSYSQKKGSLSILYTFPDSVNVAIREGVKLSKIGCDTCFLIKVSNCDNDFCIEILPLNMVKATLLKYVKLMNRFTIIQGKSIPVIVEFDMNFIRELSSTLQNTGGGYVIRFDPYGKIVSKSFQN